jgi:MerR family transcriptional regulator, mercuric resistance operon regulatory protein
MNPNRVTIGQAARAAGVSIETIRYYERLGLISKPARPPQGGYRHYPAEALARLRFIRRAQDLGFTLKEIRNLLQLGDRRCSDTRTLAAEKLATIEQRMLQLGAMQRALQALITGCDQGACRPRCNIVASLASVEPAH